MNWLHGLQTQYTELQGLTNEELINDGAITAFLKTFSAEYGTEAILKELSFDDQMIAFLYELAINGDVLNWFRNTMADSYLTAGDMVSYYSGIDSSSKFDPVYEMASKLRNITC